MRRHALYDKILNKYYIQSAFSTPTEEKRIQEKASLINIGDSFKKIIIVKDVVNVTRDEDGITTSRQMKANNVQTPVFRDISDTVQLRKVSFFTPLHYSVILVYVVPILLMLFR